jgi:hypothetical protein
MATISAPGSATPGVPASEIIPIFLFSLIGFKYELYSSGEECLFNS